MLILNFNSKRGNLCGHATRCPCEDRSIAPAAPSCRKLVKFEALCSGKLNEPDSSVAAILIHREDSLPSIQRWSRILRPSIRIRYFFLFSKALLFPFFLSFSFMCVRYTGTAFIKGRQRGGKNPIYLPLVERRAAELNLRRGLFFSCCRNNYALNNWRILERGEERGGTVLCVCLECMLQVESLDEFLPRRLLFRLTFTRYSTIIRKRCSWLNKSISNSISIRVLRVINQSLFVTTIIN